MRIFQSTIPILAYGETPLSAKDNRERSKDRTAQPITNRTQSIMRQYVSAISVPEWDRAGRIDSLSVFSESKLNKHSPGWSHEHLLSSAAKLELFSYDKQTS